MILNCKRCGSNTEVKLLGGDEVGFAVCAKCGHHDLRDYEEERIDYKCFSCGKVIPVYPDTYEKIKDKPCLSCRSRGFEK